MTNDAANAATGGTPGDGGIPAQAAAQQAQQQTGTGATPGDGGTPAHPEDTTNLRGALQKERERAEAAEKRLKELTEKDLPEAERTKRRLDELETTNRTLVQQLQTERIQSAVIAAATRLGFADPADAYSLLPADAIELEDGKPKGVDKALKELLTRKHYLASSSARASGSVDQGAKGGSKTDNDFNAMIRRAAGRG